MLTMVPDWHHKMDSGHAPAWSFDPNPVYRMYNKYKATNSLTSAELSALKNILRGKPSGMNRRGWSILEWAAEHCPRDKGIAPEPPQDDTATVEEQLRGGLPTQHSPAQPRDFDPELVTPCTISTRRATPCPITKGGRCGGSQTEGRLVSGGSGITRATRVRRRHPPSPLQKVA